MNRIMLVTNIILLLGGVILSGCGKQVKADKELKQFIEILSENDNSIGVITDYKDIVNFTNQLDIKSWEYLNELNPSANIVYTYNSYEVISDPIFLKGKEPYVSKNTMKIYELNKNFYIEENIEGNCIIAKISKKSGEFLNSPNQLNINDNKVTQEILDEWGLDIVDLGLDVNVEDSDKDVIVFTEDDIRKSSKKQRIDILDKHKKSVIYSVSDISDVVDFLNKMSVNEWIKIDEIPEESEIQFYIIRYGLGRKTTGKNMKKMYTNVLYKSKNSYYIEEIIPQNGHLNSMTINYKVPKKVIDFILTL